MTETLHLADGPAEQHVMPGSARSAHQLAAARAGALRATKPQQAPGGLFGPVEPVQEELL